MRIMLVFAMAGSCIGLAVAGNVVVPGVVYGANGEIIGVTDSHGRFVGADGKPVKCSVGTDGSVVGADGKKIGFKTDGEVLKDSAGNNRVLSRSGCYDPSANPLNAKNMPRGDAFPICATDPDAAMTKVFPMLGDACTKGREEVLYIVKTDTGYDLKRGDYGDGTATEAKFALQDWRDDVVAIIHNHPVILGNAGGGLWPSEMDVLAGLENGYDVYIRDCETRAL